MSSSGGDVILVDRRPERGADTAGFEQILVRDGQAMQRPELFFTACLHLVGFGGGFRGHLRYQRHDGVDLRVHPLDLLQMFRECLARRELFRANQPRHFDRAQETDIARRAGRRQQRRGRHSDQRFAAGWMVCAHSGRPIKTRGDVILCERLISTDAVATPAEKSEPQKTISKCRKTSMLLCPITCSMSLNGDQGSLTTCTDTPRGDQTRGSVVRKNATTGVSTAAARCEIPESLPT